MYTVYRINRLKLHLYRQIHHFNYYPYKPYTYTLRLNTGILRLNIRIAV